MTTNDVTPSYDFSADPHGLTKEDVLGQDFVFDVILKGNVGIANDSDGEISLTVVIDGQVISGIAISAKAWREGMDAYIRPGFPKLADSVGTFLTELFADLEETRNERVEADVPAAAVRYLHLRDAYILSGGASHHAPLWRGDLRKLSGWSLGSVNTPEEVSKSSE
ncbi:hypothetical protein [Arthrobacter sp. fls2-241-R2A-172]|uniref:hypothetical protein n=1 Tax=Arthrobacter sp. fls2-241-R2A-172 TaxID=3040325 RepID=UPI00254E1856|nr:hypothetical protein [Arthrobacter sp. fls2-241-R2A-172]